MLFIKILHYILGYVKFKIYGAHPERLLNILAAKGISIWQTTYHKEYIEACMYIKDYKRLHTLKGKCKIKTRYIKPVGLFVKAKSYSGRLGFAVGVLCFILTINLLSTRIWQIKIVGAEYTDTAAIEDALSDLGVYIGARKSDINAFNLPEAIILRVPELSWTALNIEGSLATLDVSEVRQVPEQEGTEPCNLIAKTDGVITGHQVTDGNLVVTTGTPVLAGDLLVSGTIEYATGYTGLKHAAGKVFANTEHTLSYTVPLSQIQQCRTGKTVTKSVVSFFGMVFPCYLGSEQYQYEAQGQTNRLNIMGADLPISLSAASFYETRAETVLYSRDEALTIAREQLAQLEQSNLGDARILSKEETIREQIDSITIENLYICNENIAVEQILSITTINS